MKQPSAKHQPLQINVSIINYRTAELTIQCAQSVLADMHGLNGVVTIVDNASGDGSVERLREWADPLPESARVNIVASRENTGFSGGHNLGMGAAKADHYLVLNSDAVLKPGCLQTLLDAAYAHPRHGLFAPRIDYDDGPQQISFFRFPTPASELVRGAASAPVSKLLKRYRVSLDNPPDPAQVGWASFACILIRDQVISQIGYMDDGYFLYFEDVEFCHRAHRAGWPILPVLDARIVHFRGGSSPVKALGKERKRLPAYYYASRTRVFYQLYGRSGLTLANLGWIFGRVVAHLRVLAGKKVPKMNHCEARDIWINYLTPLGDRRATRHG